MSARAAILLALCAAGCTCGAAPRTEIPTYDAPRARGPLVIDGVLDEPTWAAAPRTERFVHTMSGAEGEPASHARMSWDETALYVAFEVEDDFLRCDLEGHDPHLWEQDTVEIMVDPDGDGQNYFEMQLSPTNQVFDTRYASRRVPGPFGITSWDSGLRGRCVVRGTVNDDGDDEGYTAELAIPWSAFTGHAPPRAGETWRIALYVLDVRRDGWRGVGWSPPLVGDFHVPDRFGRVRFTD